MIWIPAFFLGLAGSLHCVGMCSPLVMAVTHGTQSGLGKRLVYNTGRLITYGILGAAFSLAGSLLPLSGFQNIFSISLGIVLLVGGIAGLGIHRVPFITPFAAKLTIRVKHLFSRFLKNRNTASVFLLGAINGLLPCGLTFLALTYCITLPGALSGFAFMAVFGLGTFPVMVGFTSVAAVILNRLHLNFSKVMTVMVILSGLLMIVRVLLAHAHDSQNVLDTVLCS